MRRAFVGLACVAMLLFAGSTTAVAKGPHHGGPGRYGGGNFNGRGHHHHAYRVPPPRVYRPPVCGPVAAYPVYPAPVVPAYPTFPRLSLGLGGSNFSFWYQQ